MTAIAAIVEEGAIWMGADTVGTTPDCAVTYGESKVFVRDDMIFGCAGSSRASQLLRFSLKIPDQDEDDVEYLVTRFVPALRGCFEINGYEMNQDGQTLQGSEFIIGFNGQIYELDGEYAVTPVGYDFYAAGSGFSVVMGSLFTTDGEDYSAKDRITLALQAATEFVPSCRGPYTVESLDG